MTVRRKSFTASAASLFCFSLADAASLFPSCSLLAWESLLASECLSALCVCVPPNCTDVLAPVDHHVGFAHKRLIKSLYKSWSRWNLGARQGGFSCPEKRIKLLQWADAAWAHMQRDEYSVRKIV